MNPLPSPAVQTAASPAAPRPSGGDACPRCGGRFDCGADGPQPCHCVAITLSAELQGHLRERYAGCLCPACLRALAAGASID